MGFPIDVSQFEPVYRQRNETKEGLLEKHGIPKDALICSVAGKVEAFKRQGDIIDALMRLESGRVEKQIVLFVLGTGPAFDSLQEKAKALRKNRVIFLGFVYPIDLAKLLSVSDIYIHPSEKDAHSLAISEAIYLGCPVIVSDRCGSYGPNDDVQPGKNGFVFRTGDVSDLADKIQCLTENVQLRSRFAEASRAFALESQKKAHYGAMESLVNLTGMLTEKAAK
jgi:glycosyltransferase involved in cell wall biosynthesis